MNILSALLGEHAVLKQQIESLERDAPGKPQEQIRSSARIVACAIESHAAIEDELLFVPLEASGRMPPGPVAAMRQEHETIEALIAQLAGSTEVSPARAMPLRSTLTLLAQTVRSHFGHEEHALFAIAARVLDAATLDELGARWAVRRSVQTSSVRSLANA